MCELGEMAPVDTSDLHPPCIPPIYTLDGFQLEPFCPMNHLSYTTQYLEDASVELGSSV